MLSTAVQTSPLTFTNLGIKHWNDGTSFLAREEQPGLEDMTWMTSSRGMKACFWESQCKHSAEERKQHHTLHEMAP